MKYRKGQKVEVQAGDEWIPAVVTFVWSGVDMDTGKKIFHYDAALEPDNSTRTFGHIPVGWAFRRVPENAMRRQNRARGRRRVLRAHSVKPGRFT